MKVFSDCSQPGIFLPALNFFAGLMHSFNAVFVAVLSGSLITCPIHLNLLVLIVMLHLIAEVLIYKSTFDILYGHLIFNIFRRKLLCNVSIILSTFVEEY